MKCKCGLDCFKYPDRYLCQKCDWKEMKELAKQYDKNLLEDSNAHHLITSQRHSGCIPNERQKVVDAKTEKG